MLLFVLPFAAMIISLCRLISLFSRLKARKAPRFLHWTFKLLEEDIINSDAIDIIGSSTQNGM